MASNRKEGVTSEAASAPKSEPESVYTAQEMADNHRAFNTSKEIVAVALRLAEKETATFSEAKKIIESFRTKEV